MKKLYSEVVQGLNTANGGSKPFDDRDNLIE